MAVCVCVLAALGRVGAAGPKGGGKRRENCALSAKSKVINFRPVLRKNVTVFLTTSVRVQTWNLFGRQNARKWPLLSSGPKKPRKAS